MADGGWVSGWGSGHLFCHGDLDARLQQDGTVRFIGYRREHARYGDMAAMRVIEDHFEQASEIALSLVSFTTPAQRRTAAFCMVLLAWLGAGISAGGPGVPDGMAP